MPRQDEPYQDSTAGPAGEHDLPVVRGRFFESVLGRELFRAELHGGRNFVQRQADAARNLADGVQLGPVADVDQEDRVRVEESVQALEKSIGCTIY